MNGNDIEKKVNEIWNSNSKIPFMQSKEILRFGYECGLNEKSNKSTEKIVEPQKEDIKNELDEITIKHRINSSILKILKKYYNMINDNSCTLLDIYGIINQDIREIQNNLPQLKNENGKQIRSGERVDSTNIGRRKSGR